MSGLRAELTQPHCIIGNVRTSRNTEIHQTAHKALIFREKIFIGYIRESRWLMLDTELVRKRGRRVFGIGKIPFS
jgi:hypothetical protein